MTASTASQLGASATADSDKTLARILSSLESDKAEDVVAIDLRGRSEMADHMVIASGRSSRQVIAISERFFSPGVNQRMPLRNTNYNWKSTKRNWEPTTRKLRKPTATLEKPSRPKVIALLPWTRSQRAWKSGRQP